MNTKELANILNELDTIRARLDNGALEAATVDADELERYLNEAAGALDVTRRLLQRAEPFAFVA